MGVSIVHVTCSHYTFDIRIFRKECRTLADAGYEVTLVAPDVSGARETSEEIVDGIRVLSIPYYPNRLKRMTLGAWRAYQRCRKLRPAAFHFHDPELLPWMALLKRRALVIYDVHEHAPKSVLTKSYVPRPLRVLTARFTCWLERTLARGMPLVLAEHSYEADYTWGTPQVTVLNLPRLEELTAIQAEQRALPTVAYFGTVNASRGSLTTLRALALLKQRGIRAAFECIGYASPEHAEELRQLAAELGIELHLRGHLAPLAGWALLAQCQVGLALLDDEPNYVDSYPTKVFEYMALGLPVVASDFPLYREIVEGNACGICIAPQDMDAVADAIGRLLADPAEAEAMGVRGKAAVAEKYNWDAEGAKLLAFYGELGLAR